MWARHMKKQMTKAEARSFERRWHTVNAEEKKQLRRTTIARKLRQLNALLAWGEHFGWRQTRANGVEEVRRRWAQLRRAYRG